MAERAAIFLWVLILIRILFFFGQIFPDLNLPRHISQDKSRNILINKRQDVLIYFSHLRPFNMWGYGALFSMHNRMDYVQSLDS